MAYCKTSVLVKLMHEHIVLLHDKTFIELNFAKYRDLSVSRRSIIYLCLRHRQIIDLLALTNQDILLNLVQTMFII